MRGKIPAIRQKPVFPNIRWWWAAWEHGCPLSPLTASHQGEPWKMPSWSKGKKDPICKKNIFFFCLCYRLLSFESLCISIMNLNKMPDTRLFCGSDTWKHGLLERIARECWIFLSQTHDPVPGPLGHVSTKLLNPFLFPSAGAAPKSRWLLKDFFFF